MISAQIPGSSRSLACQNFVSEVTLGQAGPSWKQDPTERAVSEGLTMNWWEEVEEISKLWFSAGVLWTFGVGGMCMGLGLYLGLYNPL